MARFSTPQAAWPPHAPAGTGSGMRRNQSAKEGNAVSPVAALAGEGASRGQKPAVSGDTVHIGRSGHRGRRRRPTERLRPRVVPRAIEAGKKAENGLPRGRLYWTLWVAQTRGPLSLRPPPQGNVSLLRVLRGGTPRRAVRPAAAFACAHQTPLPAESCLPVRPGLDTLTEVTHLCPVPARWRALGEPGFEW